VSCEKDSLEENPFKRIRLVMTSKANTRQIEILWSSVFVEIHVNVEEPSLGQ